MMTRTTWKLILAVIAVLAVVYCLLRAGIIQASAAGGILFLAATDNSLNAYSSITSSPQTTELFAKDRADTLMKYVWLANITTIGLSAIAAIVAQTAWPLIGGLLVVVLMHTLYNHAKSLGDGTSDEGNTTTGLAPVPL